MERLSIFDIFKIGVGPSSSHTLGPWLAAREFAKGLVSKTIDRLEIHLYGSLAQTGKGHATDVAIQLGLQGFDPATFSTDQIPTVLEEIKRVQTISINQQSVPFVPERDIQFILGVSQPHPNTMTLIAQLRSGQQHSVTYFSLGGGFYCRADEHLSGPPSSVILPYPIDKGEDLLSYCQQHDLRIAEVVAANELVFRDEASISQRLNDIIHTMLSCVQRGCTISGILPGGLGVKRRAKAMHDRLLGVSPPDELQEWLDLLRQQARDFTTINQWVSCFALAVNEENAALSRVVTSPTNGAAGVIPAILMYYLCFQDGRVDQKLRDFFFTAGEIGCLFKKGATISAAMGGCQAEIGVSSAMAAGGLASLMGGTPAQILAAAEIAMEHHLGLTCDPIGGLVQVPCIERNAMGAIKAITACHLALARDADEALVHFDTVVKTMWETAQDMHTKYKETSTGGLAIHLPVVLSDC